MGHCGEFGVYFEMGRLWRVLSSDMICVLSGSLWLLCGKQSGGAFVEAMEPVRRLLWSNPVE